MTSVGYLLLTAGIVATLQGAAWLGRGRRALGVAVAIAGVVGLISGVVHVRVPGFFDG